VKRKLRARQAPACEDRPWPAGAGREWLTVAIEELYGLTSQLRRACSSIPANLAGGCGRNGDAEFARFCCIAIGSASELEYHLLLARDLKLVKPKDHEELAQRAIEVKRMLTALIQKLNADPDRSRLQDFKYPWLLLVTIIVAAKEFEGVRTPKQANNNITPRFNCVIWI
jgi:four helix bundle protein